MKDTFTRTKFVVTAGLGALGYAASAFAKPPPWSHKNSSSTSTTSSSTTTTTPTTSSTTTVTTPTTTTSTSWTIADPQPPITYITNSDGLGLNLYQAPVTVTDYVIDGTADTAVLLQPLASWSHLYRFHITNACALPWSGNYGRHGVYLKAENCVLEDFYVQVAYDTPYTGSGFSVRFGHTTISRFYADALLWLSLFDAYDNDPGTMETVGPILIQHGNFVSHHTDSACWLDTQYPHPLTLYDVHGTGNGKFVACSTRYTGPISILGCTWNGNPVTSADISASPGQVTIS